MHYRSFRACLYNQKKKSLLVYIFWTHCSLCQCVHQASPSRPKVGKGSVTFPSLRKSGHAMTSQGSAVAASQQRKAMFA